MSNNHNPELEVIVTEGGEADSTRMPLEAAAAVIQLAESDPAVARAVLAEDGSAKPDERGMLEIASAAETGNPDEGASPELRPYVTPPKANLHLGVGKPPQAY